MINITVEPQKLPVYKTGIPNVGEPFIFDGELFIRIPNYDTFSGKSSFNALEVDTGKIKWFAGNLSNSYYIVDVDIKCTKVIVNQ